MRDYNYFTLVKRRRIKQGKSLKSAGTNYWLLLVLIALVAAAA